MRRRSPGKINGGTKVRAARHGGFEPGVKRRPGACVGGCRLWRRLLPLLTLLATLTVSAEPQTTPSEPRPRHRVFEDHTIFRHHKLPPHVDLTPYVSRRQALFNERLDSPLIMMLNGRWSFFYSGHPELAPGKFTEPQFDASAWHTIDVPGHWQLQGFGHPLYTNFIYPFAADPPRVMGEPPADFSHYPEARRNPTGSYRKLFTLPEHWRQRRVVIVFQGVDSAFQLWLNGHYVGYSQDSRTPAEFDLTPYLQKGENLLGVQVYQYSDGSYLEDQDMWRLSGIFRDVYLRAAPLHDIFDFQVNTRLAQDSPTATLEVATHLRNYAERNAEVEVQLELLDARNRIIARSTRQASLPAEGELPLSFQQTVEAPRLWSAETPELYTLLLAVRPAGGGAATYYKTLVGFRRVEMLNGQLLVNGRAILIKGINRHDHSPERGHAVTAEQMRRELLAMKRLNINAIRTAHYPNDPAFYELTDKLGFYVMDEANIEAHGFGWQENPLAENPEWYPAMQDRLQNMVERDKNHPSIIAWSLGNESGAGENFAKLSAWLKTRDPSRPVHYDRASREPYTDFFSEMYTPVDALIAYDDAQALLPEAQRKPAILCEYQHAMGNSLGNTDAYWQAIRERKFLQGGFVWDWRNQGIAQQHPAPFQLRNRVSQAPAAHVPGSLEPRTGLSQGKAWLASPYRSFAQGFAVWLELTAQPSRLNQPLVSEGNHKYTLEFDAGGKALVFALGNPEPNKAPHRLKYPLPRDFFTGAHRVLVSVDRTNMQIWLDGELVGEARHSGLPELNPYPLCIGCNPDSPYQLERDSRGRIPSSIQVVKHFSQAMPWTEAAAAGVGDTRVLSWLDFRQVPAPPAMHTRFVYGGYFGDTPNSGSFCMNGIMTSDLEPKPHAQELAYWYQNIWTHLRQQSRENLTLEVFNEHFFKTLANHRLRWSITENGRERRSGQVVAGPVAPQARARLTLAYAPLVTVAGRDYQLNLAWHTDEATPWAEAGARVAHQQIALPWGSWQLPQLQRSPQTYEVLEDEAHISLRNQRVHVRWQRSTGELNFWQVDGKTLIGQPLGLNFWRPPTNNDRGFDAARESYVWRMAGFYTKATRVRLETSSDSVALSFPAALPAGDTQVEWHYRLFEDGAINVRVRLQPDPLMPPMLRFGLSTELPQRFEQWQWYGRGTQENYADRNSAYPLGLHHGRVSDLFHRYADPQEAGNRTDVRWARLNEPGGSGFTIAAADAQRALSISAYPFRLYDIELADYPDELPRRDFFTLNIDAAQAGIGGTDSWGSTPLAPFILGSDRAYELQFRLIPSELPPDAF